MNSSILSGIGILSFGIVSIFFNISSWFIWGQILLSLILLTIFGIYEYNQTIRQRLNYKSEILRLTDLLTSLNLTTSLELSAELDNFKTDSLITVLEIEDATDSLFDKLTEISNFFQISWIFNQSRRFIFCLEGSEKQQIIEFILLVDFLSSYLTQINLLLCGSKVWRFKDLTIPEINGTKAIFPLNVKSEVLVESEILRKHLKLFNKLGFNSLNCVEKSGFSCLKSFKNFSQNLTKLVNQKDPEIVYQAIRLPKFCCKSGQTNHE